MTLLDQLATAAPGHTSIPLTKLIATSALVLSLSSGTSARAAIPLEQVAVEASGTVTGTGGFAAPKPPTDPNTAESVRQLRDRSGLSWEQVAALFGVSRRAVHKWASGGTLNAGHAARLARLTTVIGQLGGDPSTVRSQLLAPDDRGSSLFRQLVSEVLVLPERPEGYGVDELLGSRRDGDVTVTGEVLGAEPLDWPQR